MHRIASLTLRMTVLATACMVAMPSGSVLARTQLKNLCRIKGQEENVLRGMGLVVGLSGTGDPGDPTTIRAIARALELMGSPPAAGPEGAYAELKKIKNVSLVWVTASIPATGARRGDRVTCYCSAMNGKSLMGGRLMLSALQGPNTQDKRVYALCQGQIVIDNPDVPTVGTIQDGCQMEADIFTPFHKDGFMTLIVDANHANFQTAAMIAEEIDRKYRESLDYSNEANGQSEATVAQAIDAANILVRIPEVYRNDPVAFASDVLDIKLYEHEPEARVVINSRAGSIVISGEVEIGDVVVSHKNIVVEAITQPFVGLDIDQSNEPKLKQLVDQLNSLKVPTQDMMEIIRGIDRDGKLHGRLIVE